ncbi:hypothetical protein SDC9_38413 [bioreactor metagenome]|uniref:Uncharacterized protein n=1 Tax=bioreactor metagenome TaxID=1076179 RepID=A0A644VLZ8_9ZZZZ
MPPPSVPSGSLAVQCHHRVELGRRARGQEAEGHPDQRRGQERHHDRRARKGERDGGVDHADHRPGAKRQRDAEHAADQTHEHRLDQKLPDDVAAPRADRHAHADLAGALGHRDQHDVHHPDAADDERDHRDRGDEPGHRLGGGGDRCADGVAVRQEEVLRAVTVQHQRGDLGLRLRHVIAVGDLHPDAVEVILPRHPRHRRGVGDPDVQRRGAEGRAGRAHDADHPHRHMAEDQHLAKRVLAVREEGVAGVLVDHRDLRKLGHVAAVELLTVDGLVGMHGEVIAAHPVHRGRGRDIAMQHVRAVRHRRRDAVGIGLQRDHRGIRGHQRLGLAGIARAKAGARPHGDRIGAERGDVLQNLRLRARAERHHQHHRGDADDDAEHGQERAHPMREHRLQRHREGLARPAQQRAGTAAGGGKAGRALCRPGAAAVAHDPAVADLDLAAGMGGHGRVVGDDDHRVALGVQIEQQRDQLGRAFGVERAGRLVGQDHLAAVDQRTRHRDPLLLAARKLVRPVIEPGAKAKLGQQLGRPRAPAGPALARIDRRHLDIADRIEIAEQLIALEDEAEMLAPQPGERVGVEHADILAGKAVAAGTRPVETAQNVHQRRLARARGADDRDELARPDIEIDVAQDGDRLLAGQEGAADAAHGNQRIGHLTSPSASASGWWCCPPLSGQPRCR